MRKKKGIKHLLLVILVAAMSMAATSCGSDDDDDSGGNAGSAIVGTWRYDFSTGCLPVTFEADDTGSTREIDTCYGEEDTETFRYSYNKSGGLLVLTYSDGEREV